jgi:hypothetical protein
MLPLVLAAVIVLPVAGVSAKPAGDTTEWTFRARVKDCRIVPLNESARIGVVYTESAIKEAKAPRQNKLTNSRLGVARP